MSSTKIVTLKHGLSIGKNTYKTLTLKKPYLGEMMEAEESAHPSKKPIAYRVALAAAVLDRADDFTGPFTTSMLKPLTPSDWLLVSDALDEFETEGEDQSSAEAGS